MFPKAEFFGSVTIGERGQVVLPVKLRKKFGLKAGDKMLVLAQEESKMVHIIKADVLGSAIENIYKDLQRFRKKINASR